MRIKGSAPLSIQTCCWILFACVAFFLTSVASRAEAASRGNAAAAPPSFADLVDQVKHAVVNISTTTKVKAKSIHPFLGPNSPFNDFFGGGSGSPGGSPGDDQQGTMETEALGSGFIIDQSGFILTNNHVVEKADQIKVKLDSGKSYDAQVVGKDSKTDLALIRVTPDADFPAAAALGDSDSLRVGDWVIAVGNPFGLDHTVTAGIISAKGRELGAGPYDDFLQTDAPINPGNSGGPLYNMNGEVVGINTAIEAEGQGIGFAIPINMAKQLLTQLKTGKVIRGWLGIAIQDITPDLAQSFDLKQQQGVLVSDVLSGSPAEKAGLKRGDVIIRFNGKEIKNAHALSAMVASEAPDSQAVVEIVRDGKTEKVTVTIGTMPEEPGKAAEKDAGAWGMGLTNLTPDLAQRFGWNQDETGVLISEVKPGSAAAEAGLRPGDLIKEVDRNPVKDLGEFNKATSSSGDKKALLLLVKRGEHTFFVALKPQEEKKDE